MLACFFSLGVILLCCYCAGLFVVLKSHAVHAASCTPLNGSIVHAHLVKLFLFAQACNVVMQYTGAEPCAGVPLLVTVKRVPTAPWDTAATSRAVL